MSERRPLAVGLLGSLLLAAGGFGAGAVPPSLRWHSVLALPLCVLGVLLLVAAWWALRRSSRSLLAAALWSVPLLVTPPLFSRDVYAYAGQAHLVALGLDPYRLGPSVAAGPLTTQIDAVWLDRPSPYGPVFLWLAGHLGFGQHLVLAVLAFRLLAVVGLGLLAWGLPRLATDPKGALWLGLANPLVLLHLVAGAHNDALMIGLMVAGLAVGWTTRLPGRLVLAAAILTLAALVKVPAAAALAFPPLAAQGWRHRLRACLVVAGTAAVTAVVVTAATGLGWGWLHTVDQGEARLSLFSPTTGLGLLLGQLAVVQEVGLAAGLIVAGLLLLRADRLGPLRALGLALVVVVALGPTVQAWYLLWGIVPLAAVLCERGRLAAGAACAVLCLLVLPGGRQLIRPPLYGVPLLLAGAAAGAAYRRYPGGPRGAPADRLTGSQA